MKATDLDQKFDDNSANILNAFDIKKAHRPNLEPKRVNVDFPAWMVESLDIESNRLGITRQSLIKMWLADRLESHNHA